MSARRRVDDPALHGVLLVDKPAGPTSHDVVGWIRWVLGVRRVGHCGTLDPAATGLLVVAVGAATKLAPYLTGADKGYRARFVLGARTTTGDAEGEVVEQRPCPEDIEAQVPAALGRLQGALSLPPPVYSAIHVEGRRAHELARAGEAPVLEARPMTVHTAELGAVIRRGDRVEVEATLLVSKGTYVRSLAEALGEALGVPAHLGALHRTRSGALHLEHPRAVSGLVARREAPSARPERRDRSGRPERPDRSELPLRWRIALADPTLEAPQAAAAHLRARLLTPAEAVPLPLLRARDDESGRRALARLASGQPVALPDEGLPALDTPPAGALEPFPQLAIVPPHGPGLVLVRHEPGPLPPSQAARSGGVLHPERVIVDPTAPLTEL